MIGCGECFGEMAFLKVMQQLSRVERNADVIAASEVEVCLFGIETYLALNESTRGEIVRKTYDRLAQAYITRLKAHEE